ncbi:MULTISPECIES: EcoAI/FtnUII family type I restriction enzme subunit R [Flavobacterium]|uniref:EcoAI/FtnUII family type I restriction enzme subunit R n=1 Tax=Flavobacterium TaxID=237 RepID=UPI001182A168|nr:MULTISPECIES: DEAD/DEAH box helicase family protein [Flavobacterium]MCR4029821.1 DEAD/DEAH box helicase family protein [Flavobacterium panacis]
MADKKDLSECDICDLYITPALKNAGWDPFTQIRREVTLTPGPVIVRGEMSARNKKKKKFADYVLSWTEGTRVAVIEAKDNSFSVSHGMQQALGYAEILGVPSAFSSNGNGFSSHNKVTENGEEIETEFPLENFPTPEVLWKRYKKYHKLENVQEELILEPYYSDGSGKEPRYYQVEAINRTIEAVAKGQTKILLVMATGTGKTYTTFQIIYRLWKARRAKRILFLVDRNILADQTLVNDFKPFGSVMTKIKNRKIDPSYEIHLGLYQALTGPDESDKIFKTVSPDFFDLIVIDECHRGSSSDDSSWREILDYFNNAIQVGLTATPKETEYASNLTYFGDPVYSYSLKQGIQDGFLAPYKVVKIDIDKDIDGWVPPEGMTDDLGAVIEKRTYNQSDMDRILVLNQRTKLVASRVMKLLNATDPMSKTIIFCEDIDHAERMRKAIVNAAGKLAIDNPKYVMRITGDSIEGKAELDNFIDPESKFPVIATTSDLMTTGVDAKTCKLIVLDKTINSMIIFKQIIGRGTRIDEEFNKFFFTIMDFKKATEHFNDPAFDGDPVVIYSPGPDDDPVPPNPEDDEENNGSDKGDDEGGGGDGPRIKIVVSGISASIINERIEYLGDDGQLVTESYKDFSQKQVKSEYASLDDFLQNWNDAKKKQVIIELLEQHGVLFENLAKLVGKEYSDFDLICHVAFGQAPLTRKERANNVKKRDYFTKYGTQAKAVLQGLLDMYTDKGVISIENAKVLKLKPFSDIGTPIEIINEIFGGKDKYEKAIEELENELFKEEKIA